MNDDPEDDVVLVARQGGGGMRVGREILSQGNNQCGAGQACLGARSSQGRSMWEAWGRAQVPMRVHTWTPGHGSCCCPSEKQWPGPPLPWFLRDWHGGGQSSTAQPAAMGRDPAD